MSETLAVHTAHGPGQMVFHALTFPVGAASSPLPTYAMLSPSARHWPPRFMLGMSGRSCFSDNGSVRFLSSTNIKRGQRNADPSPKQKRPRRTTLKPCVCLTRQPQQLAAACAIPGSPVCQGRCRRVGMRLAGEWRRHRFLAITKTHCRMSLGVFRLTKIAS